MSFFLLTYDRRNGKQPAIDRYEDPAEAMDRFVNAERSHRNHDDGKGVVLLIADDEATLRRTHTHYFLTADQMLDAVRTRS
jgi:hypothetical protein